MAGELKDVWSAVQNFRDKEKAGISDIVVYTEFGPDSAQESIVQTVHRNEPNNGNPVKSEIHDAQKMDHYPENLNNHTEKDDDEEEDAAEKEKSEDSLPEKSVDESDSKSIEIDKLSLGDKNEATKQHENHHNNDKIVKIQNQKNKESQHHFFPKFLSSSKEKEAKENREKEKQLEESEPKSKTKKSLNFFRRNKSSASSPTHTSNNNSNSNQKNDSNTEH